MLDLADLRSLASARSLGLALVLLLASGCATTYDTAYDYGSRAASMPVGAAARIDATVLGVREGGSGSPASVDVRLRVERVGAAPVTLPADSLWLRLGNGEVVEASDLHAVGPAVAAAGGAASFAATFQLPGRDPATCDMSRLGLHVTLDIGGRRELVTLDFERGSTNILWVDPWGWPGPDYNGQPTGWRQ